MKNDKKSLKILKKLVFKGIFENLIEKNLSKSTFDKKWEKFHFY